VLASPVALLGVALLRYIWPSFPLLLVLDVFARLTMGVAVLVTGEPVTLDDHGVIASGWPTLLLAHGVVMVVWCGVGGLVVGALVERSRRGRGPATVRS